MAFGDSAVQVDVSLFKTGSTKALQYRVVTLTSGAVLNHTTGATTGAGGARGFGVLQEQVSPIFPSTGKNYVACRIFGITKVQGSTKAIKVGSLLVPTSGAIASTNFLGGCVKATTSNAQGVFAIGWALTSQAAAAAPGLITMFFAPVGRG